MVGTTLNHYRILRLLGSGGMGDVYAADDLKLQRQVAFKVLPALVAADPERRERFEREARAIAALNHPNIVTIYSVEQAGDLHYLTMELVDGKPLSELIPAAGLPLDRILKLAISLADALGAAHDRGIIHRDLKPANIMVTGEGRLKVLDFGLAKLRADQPAAGLATTFEAAPVTGQGYVLGTTAYMSPEQAEGKPVDHRSDIFSLGVTLYEMATGERPFKGDTSVSVVSAILKDTPRPITDVNQALPRDLGRIVRRCLTKDPEHRYQSAKDLRNDLEELKQSIDSGETMPSGVVSASTASPKRTTTWAVGIASTAVLAAIGLILFVSGRLSTRPAPGPVDAVFTQLTTQNGIERFSSLSPDGKWFVYSGDASGNEDIYLQSVGGQTAINLTKDSTDADRQPVFSSDGERIAFRSERDGGGLFVMGRTGEAVTRITDAGFNPAWSPTGEEIAFATANIVDSPAVRGRVSTLWAVSLRTREKRQLSPGDAVQPHWSPHGHRIAFWTAHGAGRQRDIATVGAAGGEPALVTNDAVLDWNPVWSPDGRYLYFSSERGGSMNLWRVPIDEPSGRTLGPPEPLTTPSRFVAHVSISSDGRRLAYTSMEFTQNIERVGFDAASGTVTGSPMPITSGSKLWRRFADVSPDGQWIAMASDRPQEDLFIARADGTGLRQLTNDAAFDRGPAWSPDGKRIAFQTNRNGGWEAWSINPDGSGLLQLTKGIGAHRPRWSPDGSRMVVSDISVNRVSIFDPRKPWESQTAEVLPAFDAGAAWTALSWSPDGQKLAGYSERGVGVYALPSNTFEKLTDSGNSLVWLSDSRRLLFSPDEGGVFVLDVPSRKLREILPVREPVTVVGISRDNQYVYLYRATTSADVWMATLK